MPSAALWVITMKTKNFDPDEERFAPPPEYPTRRVRRPDREDKPNEVTRRYENEFIFNSNGI